MLLNFESILISHGFTPDRYDFESTIIGFDYDLHISLFDSHTCFDVDKCSTYRQWNQPNEYLRADLITLTGDVDAGIQFFYQRWCTELRYQNPVREVIDVQRLKQSAAIHVLTVSQHNAMTLLFNIK
ncbi:hypothetical protein [Alkalimarinus alittae]|uniref:Uncharacterized protein n=1 Tax=Alkalimarinus alittae TaxID=2961619 RepID=A0ABY6N524_9ALTE|nr:hypothetical protein [Alkalimarinus alittae]UZE97228.1 hypothetical protein NKI27_05625 [Alkalimarinus alittae]